MISYGNYICTMHEKNGAFVSARVKSITFPQQVKIEVLKKYGAKLIAKSRDTYQ